MGLCGPYPIQSNSHIAQQCSDPAALLRPPQVCIASGRIIKDSSCVRCKTCKHTMISSEIRSRTTCPLCHAMLPPPGDKARPAGIGSGGGAGPGGRYPTAIGEDDAY